MLTAVYFSGTGNTKFCTERFIERIGNGARAFSIEDKNAVPAISECEEIILAYPVYYSDLPKIVRDFITDNRTLWHGKKVFVIADMGAFSGDGAGCSARLLRKFGADVTGGLHVVMPDCIGDVKALKKPPEENAEIVKRAAEKIDKAANDYLNGKPPRDGLGVFSHIAGLLGQRLWFYGKTKSYTQNPKIDSEKCVGCGICERVCPTKNIRTENGSAVSGNKCTLCYRCFSECPKQAITIIGKNVITQYKFGAVRR